MVKVGLTVDVQLKATLKDEAERKVKALATTRPAGQMAFDPFGEPADYSELQNKDLVRGRVLVLACMALLYEVLSREQQRQFFGLLRRVSATADVRTCAIVPFIITSRLASLSVSQAFCGIVDRSNKRTHAVFRWISNMISNI